MANKNILLSMIWGVFSVAFFILALSHYNQSKIAYPKFEFSHKPPKEEFDFYNSVAYANHNKIVTFTNEFNAFIHEKNDTDQYQNKLSAVGYLASSFLSLLSALISSPKIHKRDG